MHHRLVKTKFEDKGSGDPRPMESPSYSDNSKDSGTFTCSKFLTHDTVVIFLGCKSNLRNVVFMRVFMRIII